MKIGRRELVLSPTASIGPRSHFHRLFVTCSMIVGLMLLTFTHARAQTLYGNVVGTVTDQSGAAVPGATVNAANGLTNQTRTALTDAKGGYTITTVPQGTYRVSVSKQGFEAFSAPGVSVTANVVVRVDAQLQVGAVNTTVEVSGIAAAQLQTDTADVHSVIPSETITNIPMPTRTYEGVLYTVPGTTPPGGQISGGTNNPSRSMNFAANGTGVDGANVRIEGVSAYNPWVQQYTTFVPSVEAIQSINVVTNSPDAEQGLSGGPSVNITLRSGSNGVHGAFYEYNVTNATEAGNFFPPHKPSHLVDNDTGSWISGPIIRDKLFYFAGYEGDFINQGYPGVISVPTQAMLSGDESGSSTPIYDPATGNPDGLGRTPFPGNMIPKSRIAYAPSILASYAPAPNLPGIINNYAVSEATEYHLHKIDTKIDYQATSKLRVSGRYGYQPYYNVQDPLFGTFLGGSAGGWTAFSANGAGNYLQYGATLAISGSATYVFSPTLVGDFTFGVTQAHQLLFPTDATEKVGLDILDIPGTNIGNLPWVGGMPDFNINYYPSSTSTTWGYSYPPLQYKDPVFEYTGNITKIKGSHNIRAGEDLLRMHMNHIEVRNTFFEFTGGVTDIPGGPTPNEYNAVADFLLGLPATTNNWFQTVDWLRQKDWDIALYARDQWQAMKNLTINYGLRWEHYPVPTSTPGLPYDNLQTDINNPTTELCGVAGVPSNCGIRVSWKLFAPSVGIDYRAPGNLVFRASYALSPEQIEMGSSVEQSFPAETEAVYNGANSYLSASTTTATGFPPIPTPDFALGTLPIPSGAGNVNTIAKNFTRGYIESYNVSAEKGLKAGFFASAGYVGTHFVHGDGSVNFNYGQLGGGAASQPLDIYGITGSTTAFEPAFSDIYNSLQATLKRQMANGLMTQIAYTWSRDIVAGATAALETGGAGIAVPQYFPLNKQVAPTDRTQNLNVIAVYQLPFGRNEHFVHGGIGAALLGGWSLNGMFFHLSGLPFTVTSNGAACNCPGSTVRADRVKSTVAKVGNGLYGNSWFDPTAFAPVTTASFGTNGFNSLRGPGATNLDASVFRNFHIWERLNMKFRAEGMNITNTPHFANPGANVSAASFDPDGSISSLNGFSQITNVAPLGRLEDPRYLRLGARFEF
jgi:hypothetical protein